MSPAGGALPAAQHPDHLVTAATAAVELADESAPVAPPRGTDEVVVLDYGGQYSQLIARRVRECGVFSELLPHHVGAEEVRRRRPKGLILSGGPASVYADGAPALMTEGKSLQTAQGVGMGARGNGASAHVPADAEHADDAALAEA